LVDYDDRYEPINAVSNTERLIDHDKVFALLNFLGTPTTRAILPMVSESNIVLLGPISGAELLRQPIQPFVFNTRASYREEAEMLVSHLVADTLSLLTPSAPLTLRMETIRRATIYASTQPAIAANLMNELKKRSDAKAPLAAFDYGYLVEAFREGESAFSNLKSAIRNQR